MADELRTPETTNPPQQAPQQFQTDASNISTVYTNFCKVSMTPEELIMDFGLNPALNPNPAESIKLTHRVVMNFYTAKRMLGMLMQIIQQHESAFGALELDFNKRMRGGRPASPSLTPKQ